MQACRRRKRLRILDNLNLPDRSSVKRYVWSSCLTWKRRKKRDALNPAPYFNITLSSTLLAKIPYIARTFEIPDKEICCAPNLYLAIWPPVIEKWSVSLGPFNCIISRFRSDTSQTDYFTMNCLRLGRLGWSTRSIFWIDKSGWVRLPWSI